MKTLQIESYFNQRFADLDILAKVPLIIDGLEELEKAHAASGLPVKAFIKTPQYDAINKKIDPWLRNFFVENGFADILVANHKEIFCTQSRMRLILVQMFVMVNTKILSRKTYGQS